MSVVRRSNVPAFAKVTAGKRVAVLRMTRTPPNLER